MMRQMMMAVVMVAVMLAAQAATADVIIDNFESYTNGQTLGNSATSTPWRRVGAATSDNVTATAAAAKVISGSVSGQYSMAWTGSTSLFGSARRVLPGATDLSSAAAVVVKMKSTNASTQTTVKLLVSDGTTIFESKTAQALTSSVQTLSFAISAADMTRTTGSADLTTVLHAPQVIGFTFRSTAGTYSETVVFDDFAATIPVPEPAAAAIGLGLVLAMQVRNRVR